MFRAIEGVFKVNKAFVVVGYGTFRCPRSKLMAEHVCSATGGDPGKSDLTEGVRRFVDSMGMCSVFGIFGFGSS